MLQEDKLDSLDTYCREHISYWPICAAPNVRLSNYRTHSNYTLKEVALNCLGALLKKKK